MLTADRKPHEISDIADRLRTRFAWGLLADIEPPELEVRIAILRKKAARLAVQEADRPRVRAGDPGRSDHAGRGASAPSASSRSANRRAARIGPIPNV